MGARYLVLRLVSAFLNSIKTNITTVQLKHASRTITEVYDVQDEHRSINSANLTTAYLSFITTNSYDMYHI